ncbi:MAG: hypothetical protein JWO38_43 [Gemmataceae bacterium]|nr:hypothetical protein [Gemmataceae bacterium]
MAPADVHEKVREILAHTRPLPPGADSPVLHFAATGKEIISALAYVGRKAVSSGSIPAAATRHLGRLRQMALVSLVENLERFIKELAAECVDVLAPITADDRFDTFRMTGSAIAGHFGTDTLGRALCESGVWLDCKSINDRFRDLLSDPFTSTPPLQPFHLFPMQPQVERARYDTLQLVWQLRHTVVHNVGVITQSDAVKLRVLSRTRVEPLRVLVPTDQDLEYLLRFVDMTATETNRRVAERLAELLTRIHAADPLLIDPTERAGHLTRKFRVSVTVAGVNQLPPP